MKTRDFKQFTEKMGVLGEVFLIPMPKWVINLYFESLKDLTWDMVEGCIMTHLKYSRHMPSPTEIRKLSYKIINRDAASELKQKHGVLPSIL